MDVLEGPKSPEIDQFSAQVRVLKLISHHCNEREKNSVVKWKVEK